MAEADRLTSSIPSDQIVRPLEELPVWSRAEIRKRHGEWVGSGVERRRRVLLVIEGCVVDAGGYLDDHVSGLSVSAVGQVLEMAFRTQRQQSKHLWCTWR
jgi:stearoyl-CoA desaturase (delta-9 desaturase)